MPNIVQNQKTGFIFHNNLEGGNIVLVPILQMGKKKKKKANMLLQMKLHPQGHTANFRANSGTLIQVAQLRNSVSVETSLPLMREPWKKNKS